MNQQPTLTRRDFLRLILLAGSATVLSPLLESCSRGNPTKAVSTGAKMVIPTSSTTPSTSRLLEGLDNLDIDTFFRESFLRMAIRDPESLTELGLADYYGVGDANLNDISEAYIRDTQALEAGILAILQAYNRSTFSSEQSLTFDIYEWYLDDIVRGHAFMYDNYPLNPIITSVHYGLYFLFTIYHPLNNLQDAEDYLARLKQVGTKIDQLIEGLKRRKELGIVLPAFMIPFVLSDIDNAGREPARSHDYFTTFNDRLTGVSSEERTALLAQVETAIDTVVIPAYQGLSSFLKILQKDASDEVGVWQFTDGKAVYAQALRHHSTTDSDADQIEALGMQHLERVHAEMRQRFEALGYSASDEIAALFRRLTADEGVYRGQQTVQAYEEAIRGAEVLIANAFDTFPQAGVDVVGGLEGDYYSSSPYDRSRPGIFYARTNSETPRYGVKTLAYHETIPGHHTQITIAQELPNQSDLRKGVSFTAYVEGWALYAERLMWELGAYKDDIPGDLGRLQAEAFRAARLVVDTGIHARRWSFDRATKYLAEATGFPLAYTQQEVTRYAVWPGQATAYYMGFLKIIELRQRIMDALGSEFELKTYHSLVIGNGPMPLPVLEQCVDHFLTTENTEKTGKK